MSTAAMIAKALKGRPASGSGYLCHCPVASHGRRRGDRNPSLLIRDGDFQAVVVHCFVGCDPRDVLAELRRQGLIENPASSSDRPKHNGAAPDRAASRILEAYDYPDESGEVLYQSVRFEPKAFKQRRPDGHGDWIWKLDGVRRVPYRLPELIEAIGNGHPVVIVEGEKDVETLRAIGITATCNAGGAGKWRDEYAAHFADGDVIVIPDNDDIGRKHADCVAASLHKTAARIRLLELPGLPPAGDVSDWLAAGGTAEALWKLVETAPEWTPLENIQSKAQEKSGLVTVCAADVTPKRVDALWKGDRGAVRLARGEHTLIAGEPGLGKSQLGIYATAMITTGGAWPCSEGRARKGHVIILSAEDDEETTIVPRLIAAGADLSRVTIIRATYSEDGKDERAFDLQTDLAKLEKLIEYIKKETGEDVLLVVIDPITAYMGGGIDGRKNVQVRATLRPVGEMARRTKVAILSVTHFNKGASGAATKALLPRA